MPHIHFKDVLDWVAGSIAFGALLKILPAVASLMTIIWTGVRLWDHFKGKKNADKQLD